MRGMGQTSYSFGDDVAPGFAPQGSARHTGAWQNGVRSRGTLTVSCVGGGQRVEQTTVNGRYRIDRRIGDGGMAEVYLGLDVLLNRQVAVKVLRDQFARDPAVRLRFEREAQAAANFSHPHIVEVYDVGELGNVPYIVMEFVQGETLKQVIDDEGPFDADDVSALLEQIGAALDYAHARGVVHRDVKPQNILVDRDGLAKVTDFGIAKAVTDSSLTETGTGIGTVHYLSPEQANGLMATPASDVYSLGVVAYEMLTRELPFDAESPVAVAVAHTRDEPPRPSTLEPTITGAVDAIILKALEKDPTRRYRSAGDFAATMSDWKAYRPDRDHHDGGHTDAGAATRRNGRVHEPEPADPAAVMSLPFDPAYQASHGVEQYAGEPRHWAPPPPQPVGMAMEARRNDVGCGTWLTGGIVLAALVALIVLGARFSDGVPAFSLGPIHLGADNASPTATGPAAPAPAAGNAASPSASATGAASNPPPTGGSLPVGGAGQTVAVPDLTGQSVTEAQATVATQGLTLNVTTDTRFSDTVPNGNIAQQDPPAGAQVGRGSVIAVIRSRGPSSIDLTSLNLVSQSPDAATGTLQALGLTVSTTEVGSSTIPKGQVADVTPSDTVSAGGQVTLGISQGNTIQIPTTIFGMNRDQAATQLTHAGFVIRDQQSANRKAITDAGVDLQAAGIEDGDVVGVQDANGDASFGVWLPPGTELTLVYYDASRDGEASAHDDGVA